jgi:hypothetical protein
MWNVLILVIGGAAQPWSRAAQNAWLVQYFAGRVVLESHSIHREGVRFPIELQRSEWEGILSAIEVSLRTPE